MINVDRIPPDLLQRQGQGGDDDEDRQDKLE